MSIWSLILSALFLSLALRFAALVQERSGKSGWIDAIWSLSVGLAALGVIAAQGKSSPPAIAVFVLIGLWSARLMLHIAARTHNMPDDPRYAALKQEWGEAAPGKMVMFLQAQALAGWILVVCAGLAASSNISTIQTATAFTLGLVALLGEAVADEQLRRAKIARQRLCDKGLWAFSRHPNYFCEWLFWLAIALFALDFSGKTPIGFLAVVAPLMMYWLLVHVSGVPLLEAHMATSRGTDWQNYARKVPKFWPWGRASL